LKDGDLADVTGPAGTLTARVEVTDDIRRGVVSLPHGFGHTLDGIDQSITEPGVSINAVTDSSKIDPLSGNAALTAVPVVVEPARELTEVR
jgi:anaerobic selenocysteine-containing dehydrogenase